MPNSVPNSEARRERRRALWALLLVVPIPTLGVYLALIAAPGPIGQAAFLVSKVWILFVPWLWVRFIDGTRVRPALRCPGARVALGTGLLFATVIASAYVLVGRSTLDFSALGPTIADAGISSPAQYIGAALYWTLINSLIEEYVWRWFVATKCEQLMPRAFAIVVAAGCFSLHHYVAIVAYATPGIALLGTVGVFLAAIVWSWLYLRYRSAFTPYISHVLADAAIFAVGYHIVFGG